VRFQYNGIDVFRADLHTGVAANPLLQFTTIATESGVVTATWSDEQGLDAQASARVDVT
jgi:sulfur-oxidizing protein SoxZ